MLALVKTLPKRRVAIAGGQNLAALHAGIECVDMGLGTPVYVGPREAIRRLAGEKFPAFDIDSVEIVEAVDDQSIAVRAVELVRNGDAGILLKGGVNTPTLMKAALASGTGLRAGSLLSDSFLFEYPDEDGIRLIAITDGGLNQQPSAQQKIDILKNAVVVSHALGNPDPRVGMLAASETVSPNLPASMDAAVTMHMNRAGRIAGCIVEGPMALDVAVSRKAAAIKGTDSDVAGQADILVASSIDTANALAKSTTYFAGYRLAHVIVGATAPILIASRSDSSDAKLLSIALGSLMAKYFEERRGA
jgi:phosphate butyryltransferase